MNMKILSCGAGMQSTSLALISCEQTKGVVRYPQVPRYDAVIYCDLGIEPPWVIQQVRFIQQACESCDISFVILKSNLYRDYMDNFGRRRVAGMPFWTIDPDGKKGRISRHACTIDYKILMIQKYVRYQMLGYRPYEHNRPEDVGRMSYTSVLKRRTAPLFPQPSSLLCQPFPVGRDGLGAKGTPTSITGRCGGWIQKQAPARFVLFTAIIFFSI